MHDYNIKKLFSSPIYNSKVELNSELELLKSLEFGCERSGKVKITENTNLLNDPLFAELKTQVDNHFETYIREVLHINSKQKFRMIKSWGVRSQEGEDSIIHQHANSIFSGVLYLRKPNNTGCLTFFKKSPAFPDNIEFDIDEYNIYNSSRWGFDAEESEIYIFPSNIEHMVAKNKSRKERYSIAFDYWVHEGFAGITNSN